MGQSPPTGVNMDVDKVQGSRGGVVGERFSSVTQNVGGRVGICAKTLHLMF